MRQLILNKCSFLKLLLRLWKNMCGAAELDSINDITLKTFIYNFVDPRADDSRCGAAYSEETFPSSLSG